MNFTTPDNFGRQIETCPPLRRACLIPPPLRHDTPHHVMARHNTPELPHRRITQSNAPTDLIKPHSAAVPLCVSIVQLMEVFWME